MHPLQYSCLENPMDRGAWQAAVHGVATSQIRLNDFTFTFHFPALEKEMATHSSVLAWRIPGTGEPGGCRLWGRTESDRTEATQQQQQQKNLYANAVYLGQHILIPFSFHIFDFEKNDFTYCVALPIFHTLNEFVLTVHQNVFFSMFCLEADAGRTEISSSVCFFSIAFGLK